MEKKRKQKKKTVKSEQNKFNNIKPCNRKLIYLDHNSTTPECNYSKKVMIKWIGSCSNPSSDSLLASKSKDLLNYARSYICKHLGISEKNFTIIFTSGASESNCTILRSVVTAYAKETKKKPHIITSSIEHNSIISCCNSLRDANLITITWIEPNTNGCINPELVEKAITKNTAIISIMAANNELGCINNIKKIGEIAHKHNIPFHTDAVQLFGKYKIPMVKNNIDALSMSFHKVYGPQGVGMLIINNELIDGYNLEGVISGTQQKSFRGGTENVAGIAGSIAGIIDTFKDRNKKNEKLLKYKNMIINGLKEKMKMGNYSDYVSGKIPKRNEFVVLGLEGDDGVITNNDHPKTLPNTLMISFAKNKKDENDTGNENGKKKVKKITDFCNIKLKKDLAKDGIVVSIGSACSTASKSASHVLYGIRAPKVIRQGAIRISIGDTNTKNEIEILVKSLIKNVRRQMRI